ncbi:MAG TPA: hypothetical protein PKA90_07040, partial [Ignavibacteria bacterium]|nr:hypothetical protein [Ignavibacteria bacterium]
MKLMKLIFVLMICFTEVYSQTAETNNSSVNLKLNQLNTNDTTNTCTIIMNSRSVYKDVQLFGLKDSTVGFFKDEKSGRLNVSDIRTIKFDAKGFWKGALYGGAAGFLAGFAVGISEGFDLGGGGSGNSTFGQGMAGGFFLSIPFGLIGGGIGSLLAEDHLYDMSDYSFLKKRSLVYFLI